MNARQPQRNRIDQCFARLREARRGAFIAYVTAGDPNLSATEAAVKELEACGADLIELGVPFSDPQADGPTIQAASQRALDNGVTLAKIFASAARIRRTSQIPLVLMTYYNPVFYYGEQRFIAACRDAGIDGLIIPDLPPEEGRSLIKLARTAGVATIFFASPTTRPERMPKIAAASRGFIYFVSVTGVTGARTEWPSNIAAQIKALKQLTDLPVCVGFGVSRPDQVKAFAKYADGVIVGSAIVKEIEKGGAAAAIAGRLRRLVKPLRAALG